MVCDALSIRTALEGILLAVLAVADLAGAGLEKSFVHSCDFSNSSTSDERSRPSVAERLAQHGTGETLDTRLYVKICICFADSRASLLQCSGAKIPDRTAQKGIKAVIF